MNVISRTPLDRQSGDAETDIGGRTKQPAMATARTRLFTVGIVAGYALVILGVGAYVVTDFASITALIPAFLGIVAITLGRLGRDTDRDQVSAYGLGLLALLGIGGSAPMLGDVGTLVTGGDVERPIAAGAQGLTVLLCAVLLVATAAWLLEER